MRALLGAPRPGIRVQTGSKWAPQDLTTQLCYVAMAAVAILTEYLQNVKCFSKDLGPYTLKAHYELGAGEEQLNSSPGTTQLGKAEP